MTTRALCLLGLLSFAAGCAGGPADDPAEAPERLDAKEDGPLVPFASGTSYSVAMQNFRVDHADGTSTTRPLKLDLNGVYTQPCASADVCYPSPNDRDWLDHQRFSGDELRDGTRFAVHDAGDQGTPTFGPTDGVLGAINSAIQGTGTYRVKIKLHGLEVTGVTFEARFTF